VTFARCLLAQARLHPALMPQDAVKLCYQAAFGAEHLVMDAAMATQRFEAEYAATPAAEGPLCEPISRQYARVNLAAWKHAGLPPSDLLHAFLRTAAQPPAPVSHRRFQAMLACTGHLAAQGKLPFSAQEWQGYLCGYRHGPVHHSDLYRSREKPAYRVVDAGYVTALQSPHLL